MAKHKKKKSKKTKGNLLFNKTLFKLVFWLGVILCLFAAYCYFSLPNMEKAVLQTRLPTTTITDENGTEIKTFGTVYADVLMSDDVPFYVKDAIIATEDRRFYEHFGFDPISFTRAMLVNLLHLRYVQGASTITQQVAKNLFLTRKKNLKRKMQELMLAFWLEKHLNKEQILTLYLNRVYFGNGAYGLEAASQRYFQKSAVDLNLLESAILAGMLKAPNRYNPIVNKDRAIARAAVVLQNMVNQDIISSKAKNKALKQTIGQAQEKPVGTGYFADWALSEAAGYIGESADDTVVFTTLNPQLQKATEQIVGAEMAKYKDKNVTQAAVVVLDKSGAVKAMVGGVNYAKSQFNRAVQALRQPGSAFKPFVYLTALEQGYKAEDIIEDKPISIKGWAPENHDKKIHGRVTLSEALAKSLNLATVNLSEKIGRPKVIKTAKKLGISTPIINTPALALGANEVRVLDMAAAYSVFANGGKMTWPYTIKEIYNKDGFELYMRELSLQQQIVSEESSQAITQMLQKVIAEGTGYRAQLPFFVAGKTGTSQDFRDAWFVGYSNKYIIAIWVGNDDNSPMKNVGGSSLPAQIWKKIMLFAQQN